MSSLSGQEHFLQLSRNTDAIPSILSRANDGIGQEKVDFSPSLPHDTVVIAPHRSEIYTNIHTYSEGTCLETLHKLAESSREERLKALPFLLLLLDHPIDHVRVTVVELMGEMQEQIPLEALLKALRDPYWDVRAAAAQALGNRSQTFPAQQLLHAFVEENDLTVRETIIRVFGKYPDQLPIQILIQVILYDPNWLVREAAAWSLGQLGQNMPLSPLLHALKCDSDEAVRAACARSLGKCYTSIVEKALFYTLEHDNDEEVCEAAAWALQQFDEETQGSTPIPQIGRPF